MEDENKKAAVNLEDMSSEKGASCLTEMFEKPQEGESTGARPKQYTEKGRVYSLDGKEKELKTLQKQLKEKTTIIDQIMKSDLNAREVEKCYADWLILFEKYLNQRDTYKSLLLSPEEDIFAEFDTEMSAFKYEVEQWMLEKTVPVNPLDSISQVGKSNRAASSTHRSKASSHSSISTARILEEQKKAELTLRKEAMIQKRSLEPARLNLKLQEEELRINTEIAISQAKTRVLDQFESTKDALSQVYGASPINLNADAPVFVPSKDIGATKSVTYIKTSHVEGSNVGIQNESDTHHDYNPHSSEMQDFTPLNQRQMLLTPVTNIANTDFQMHQFTDTQNQLASVVRQLRKPIPEIKRFSGDPLEYKRFIRQFNTKIVINTEDDEERLNYLEQYTDGEANKIVTGYGYLDAHVGYTSALKELNERYGNNEVVANAFIKRALDWPAIKYDSPKSLDEFSIFLSECENAIHSIEAVKVLEYPDNLKKLVCKLPYSYHDKWRNIVQQTRVKEEQIKFTQLVKFVKSESKKANDPTYGKDALKVEPKQNVFNKMYKQSKSKGTFATKVNDQSHVTTIDSERTYEKSNYERKGSAFNIPCIYCDDQQHSMDNCEKLTLLPYQEKMDFLKSKRLCYGCLKFGHKRKNCRNKATCLHCRGRHPSVCHVEGKVPRLEQSTHVDKDKCVKRAMQVLISPKVLTLI